MCQTFYPEYTEDLALEIGVLAIHSWLQDIHDQRKTVNYYLWSIENAKSWANISPKENLKLLGSFARNDIARQVFEKMTHMYEEFNMILGGIAAGVTQAGTNGNCKCKIW